MAHSIGSSPNLLLAHSPENKPESEWHLQEVVPGTLMQVPGSLEVLREHLTDFSYACQPYFGHAYPFLLRQNREAVGHLAEFRGG